MRYYRVSFLVLTCVLTRFPGDPIMAACQTNPENVSPGCARRSPSGLSRRSSRATSPGSPGDDKLTGFGLRVQPTGTKVFLVNYRAGDGGRKAPNKRVTIGPLWQGHRRAGAEAGPEPARPGRRRCRSRLRARPWPVPCPPSGMPSRSTWRSIPIGRNGPTSSTATRPTAIWATGSRALSTPLPAGMSKFGSTASPRIMGGRRPTGRSH